MSVNQVIAPFITFKDIDGNPLHNAYVYIGEPGLDAEGTPKAAYWDAALSNLVTQPIRTRNGFPDNGGSPGSLYVDGDYSITVKDRTQSIVQATTNVLEDSDREPLIVLGLGASNMAINENATGGRRNIPTDGVFLWDSSQHAASTYTEGSQYDQAEFGTAPLDLLDTGGFEYANSLLLQTCINLRETTGRPVYGIICAMGGHGPLNYLTDATLAANGWSRAGGTEDMTLHYGNIASAIAAVPGGKSVADVCLWYGTQGASSGQFPWQTQFDLVWDQAVTSGLISEARTRIVSSTTGAARPGWANVKQAISRVSADRPNMVTADNMGSVFPDNVHMDGNSVTDYGKQLSAAGMGGGITTTRALVLTSSEHGAPESQTFVDDWNGDNVLFRKYSDEGWYGFNFNVSSGAFKIEDYDAVGDTTTEHFRVETNGRVGINEANPQTALHVSGSAPLVRVENDDATGVVGMEFRGTTGALSSIKCDVVAENIRFSTKGETFAGLVDDNQWLLWGHDGSVTAEPGVGNTQTGVTVKNGGHSFFSREGGPSLRVNRNTTDGKWQTFQKDGVEIASFEVRSGFLLSQIGGGVIRGAGTGTPEGNITADVGSTWQRSDGGAGTSFYVKESGTGNTGWVAK